VLRLIADVSGACAVIGRRDDGSSDEARNGQANSGNRARMVKLSDLYTVANVAAALALALRGHCASGGTWPGDTGDHHRHVRDVDRAIIGEQGDVRLVYHHRDGGKPTAAVQQAEVDPDAMVDLAERATERLAEPDRILVLRALKQPSAQGRKAYVSKLIRQARMVGAG
jgi:hypothetical protein